MLGEVRVDHIFLDLKVRRIDLHKSGGGKHKNEWQRYGKGQKVASRTHEEEDLEGEHQQNSEKRHDIALKAE